MKTLLATSALCLCLLIASTECLAKDKDNTDEWFSVLAHSAVQLELEISDEQAYEIESLVKRRRKVMDDLRSDFRKEAPKDETRQEARERMIEFTKIAKEESDEIGSELKDLLLPHQIDRIKQVAFQIKLQSSKMRQGSGLLAPEMVEVLEISEMQSDRIRKKEKEIKAKLEQKMKQLWLEAEEELREELTRKQRQKYDELVGSPFDLEKNQYKAMSLAKRRSVRSGRNSEDLEEAPTSLTRSKTSTSKNRTPGKIVREID